MIRSRPVHALSTLLALGVITLASAKARAATINVTTTANNNTVDGQCALPEAIMAAENDSTNGDCTAGSGADTIVLQAGQTYQTTTDGFAFGITTPVTISGNGATLDATNTTVDFDVFTISGLGDLTVNNLTMKNGTASPFWVDGTSLALSGCLIDSFNINPIILDAITITNNVTSVSIDNTEFRNIGCSDAGAYVIQQDGPVSLTITRSLFASNTIGILDVGGGTAKVINSTFSGNSGSEVAYAAAGATLKMSSCTVYGNTTVWETFATDAIGSTFEIKSSIVAGNTVTTDGNFPLNGTFTSDGNNIVSVAGPTDGFSGTETNYAGFTLPALANNGGPTRTHLPGAGNAAIDNGACTDADGTTLNVDQRSLPRPSGATCDVGAVEVQGASNPTISVSPSVYFGVVTIGTPTNTPLTLTNSGGGSLTITNMAMTGGNSGDFAVNLTHGATCPTLNNLTLTALQSCTVNLVDTATAPAGNKSTTFRLTSNTGGTTGTTTDVALSSTAVAAGSIPTLSEWGMMAMFLGLAGAMFHTMKKRQPAGEA
jgi:hypothetical protein